MYIDKKCVRGYNEYTNCDIRNGEGSMMDTALLIMEAGDVFEFCEEKKELAWILLQGKATVEYDGKTVEMDRPNPFDYSTWCLLLSKGSGCKLTAQGHCEFYVQKTYNDREYPAHLYTPEETDTWRRGANGECGGCIKRDVRTSFDYENAPWSNMVLGEVVNLPGALPSAARGVFLPLRAARGLRRGLGERRSARAAPQRHGHHHRGNTLHGHGARLCLLLYVGHPSPARRSVGEDPHR